MFFLSSFDLSCCITQSTSIVSFKIIISTKILTTISWFILLSLVSHLKYLSSLCPVHWWKMSLIHPLPSVNCQSDTFTHFPRTSITATSVTKEQQEVFIFLFNLDVCFIILIFLFFLAIWFLSASVDSF